MKQISLKKFSLAILMALAVPATILAQDDKDAKNKKEKRETRHIMITTTGTSEGKMVVEIDGDKVKINGKDAKDVKDANVHVTTIPKGDYNFNFNGQGTTWNKTFNSDEFSLFSQDENRAMLGVVTEGHEKGAVIKQITKESGADKAGLKKGDILTKIDNKEIESTDDVTEIIRSHKPGDKVSVNIIRDGKEQKLTAELGKWKGIQMNRTPMPAMEAIDVIGEHRVDVAPRLHADVAQVYGYGGGRPKLGLAIQDSEDGEGVVVLEVDEESNAAKAGLKKDDVIIAIDNQDVKRTDDVVKATKTTKDKYNFTYKVKRDGKTQNIEVKMPRKLKTADL